MKQPGSCNQALRSMYGISVNHESSNQNKSVIKRQRLFLNETVFVLIKNKTQTAMINILNLFTAVCVLFLINYDGPRTKVFSIQYLFFMVARWHLARAISSIINRIIRGRLDIWNLSSRVHIRYLTRSLRSLIRYQCEHSKINSISPRAHVLFSISPEFIIDNLS